MSWIIAIVIISILMFVNSVFHPFDQKKGYKLLFWQGINGLENKECEIKIEKSEVWLYIEDKTYQIKMKNVELLKQITEKDKSVVGRAIVGGIAFGVVGAVVGGMSGIGTKKENTYCLKVTTESYELYFKPVSDYEFDFSTCFIKLNELLPKTSLQETNY